MIIYNKLELKNHTLYFNFEMGDEPYYNNSAIDGIRVDTPLTYGTEYPFYYAHGTDFEKFILDGGIIEGSISTAGSKSSMFIITPIVDELPTEGPCGSDIVDKAVIYDKQIILDKGLAFLKELGDTCNIPRGFIDFILRHKAMDMAIETCNYELAIKYWNMFMTNTGTTITGCGCYGK